MPKSLGLIRFECADKVITAMERDLRDWKRINDVWLRDVRLVASKTGNWQDMIADAAQFHVGVAISNNIFKSLLNGQQEGIRVQAFIALMENVHSNVVQDAHNALLACQLPKDGPRHRCLGYRLPVR